MPLPKSDADKLVGKRVTLRYKQTYTNGRSEVRTETGKVLEVTATGITLSLGTMSMGGFGRVPVESVISLSKIIEVK